MSKDREFSGKRGIYWKSNTLYARLVVPADLKEHFETGELLRSLQTRDLKVAEYRAAQIFHEWKTQFDKLRGSSQAVNQAMTWKTKLEEEKRRDKDLLAAFRRNNRQKTLTSADIDELGLGSTSIAFSEFIEEVAETEGPDSAKAIANIARGTSFPTLHYAEEWKASLKVIPRTLQMMGTRLKTLQERFPALPVKKTEVAKWIMELESQDKAEATIKGLIGGCRSYYDYLIRLGHVDPEIPNPFERHKYARKKKASRQDLRQAWEVEDLIKLVNAAKHKDSDPNLCSLIILGAFTGARIEELAKLKKTDIKTRAGVRYFSIEESKSKAGLRDIPIHKDIDQFVSNLVEKSSDQFLLPGEPVTEVGERSSAIGKRFGRLKTSLGYDGRYVFHSLRKTLSTQLERLGLHHNQAAEITGHEKIGETYGTYSAGLTIQQKAEFLNQVKYDGLVLPSV